MGFKMANVITLKSDSNGNHLHAEVIFDDKQGVTVIEYHFNGECFQSKEYPYCEVLTEIIKDINNEIDKML